jgi:hypothetical protein
VRVGCEALQHPADADLDLPVERIEVPRLISTM